MRTTTPSSTDDTGAECPSLHTNRVPAQGVSSYALRDLAAGEERVLLGTASEAVPQPQQRPVLLEDGEADVPCPV